MPGGKLTQIGTFFARINRTTVVRNCKLVSEQSALMMVYREMWVCNYMLQRNQFECNCL